MSAASLGQDGAGQPPPQGGGAGPASAGANGGSDADTVPLQSLHAVPEALSVAFTRFRLFMEDNGWYVLLGLFILWYAYTTFKPKSRKMMGSIAEAGDDIKAARERQQERLAAMSRSNPAPKQKDLDRARKRRKNKRRFDPDAPWVAGENTGGNGRFRPDARSRNPRFGRSGGGG